jgi:hypothetical protein
MDNEQLRQSLDSSTAKLNKMVKSIKVPLAELDRRKTLQQIRGSYKYIWVCVVWALITWWGLGNRENVNPPMPAEEVLWICGCWWAGCLLVCRFHREIAEWSENQWPSRNYTGPSEPHGTFMDSYWKSYHESGLGGGQKQEEQKYTPTPQASRVETRNNNNSVQSTGIALAVQRGSTVFVYNDKNSILFSIGAGQGLVGYTNRSVNIQRGDMIFTYNEKGSQIAGTRGSY